MAAKRTTAPKKAPAAPAAAAARPAGDNAGLLAPVRLTMTAELGRTRETFGRLLDYGEQSVVELDKTVGEPVDILLNGELFARGEVVTVGENFGVRVTQIVGRPGA